MTDFHPSWSEYRKAKSGSAPALIVVVVVVVGAAVVRSVVDGSWIGFAIVCGVVLLTIGLCLGYITMLIKRSRVRLNGDQIEYRGWLGRTRALSIEDGIDGILTEYVAAMNPSTNTVLFLRSRAGGRRIRLGAGLWSYEDLKTIATSAGIVVSTKVMRVRDIEAIAPGALPRSERHPFLFAMTFVAMIFALIVVATFVYLYAENEAPFHQ